MLEKISHINLNLDNFIFIAPEAQSIDFRNSDVWEMEISKCKEELGGRCEVFVNFTKGNICLENIGYKTCPLSISQAFVLASKAKKILALRSGFSEILTQTQVPIKVLYGRGNSFSLLVEGRAKVVALSPKQFHSGFTLKKLPMIDAEKIEEIILS